MTPSDNTILDDLESRLKAGAITSNLLRISLATLLYELIKSQVLDGPEGFFDGKGTREYQEHVRALDAKSDFRASLAWYVTMDVLTSDQVELVHTLKATRDLSAHEGGKVLVDSSASVEDSMIADGAEVLRKIGNFWGQVSVQCDPNFDTTDVEWGEIQSGDSLLFDHVLTVATHMIEVGRRLDETETETI